MDEKDASQDGVAQHGSEVNAEEGGLSEGNTGLFEEGSKQPHNVETRDIDPAMDRLITRKLDKHVLGWLFGIWLFAFIDRSNIGNAKIDGILTDLSLGGTRFNVALTVFYIPYILVNVPSNLILKRVGSGFYLPFLITCWGIVSCFMGLTKSYGGLIVCRLLLGLFEGGLFCGMILYLSMFYRSGAPRTNPTPSSH